MTTQLIRDSMKFMIDAGLDVVDIKWFDMTGAFSDQHKADLDPVMFCKPPFDKCFVVWRGKTKSYESYEVLMMIVGDDPNDGIAVSMFKGPTGSRLMKIPAMLYYIENDEIKYQSVDENEPITKQFAEIILAALGGWYKAMNHKVEAYVPTIKNTFTNRRKIQQNKMPTYDWTTVYIEPSKPKTEGKGGTHASPRLHDRRGHLRRLKTGKNVWVKSCKVGDASKGIVFHDYVIKE